MAQFLPRNVQSGVAARADSGLLDVGLRAHMLRVYNYLAAGIGLAAIIAYVLFSLAVTNDPALAVATLGSKKLTAFGAAFFMSPIYMVVAFAPLVMLIGLMFLGDRLGVFGTQVVYWTLVSLIGASLSMVFLRYRIGSAAQVFAITSVAFASLSLWGYTTKRDLSGFGTFLMMGLIGIILASLLNLWFQSGALQFAISCIGVLVFAGLTAYDTQRIKDEYLMIAGDAVATAKAAVWGALSLFLDFVNLFQFLLSLLGNRD
jgi:uncharacterized protein